MSLSYSQISNVTPDESISQINYNVNIDNEDMGESTISMNPCLSGLSRSPAYFIVTKDTLAEGKAFLKVSTWLQD